MRKIKFRAFNVNHQMMHYGVETQDLTYFLESKDFETMQYTGLTDRNGKEIYEGDIIYWDYNVLGEGLVKVYRVVSWDEEGYWNFHDDDKPSFCPRVVVGNIHENPEILGGADNE